ncbi:MAG: S-layer homology domain-containing protein [Bacillota bacterium]|nr:S-layer homology domain-containing protein [Bacillota bacterium]
MKKFIIALTAILIIATVPAFADTVTFYDISGYPWAVQQICSLAEKGVIQGTSLHYYSPSENVSRADICTLLCRTFQIEGVCNGGYADVANPSDYYYSYVSAMKTLGIVKADVNGNFRPYESATRETTMRLAGFMLIRFGFYEDINTSVLDAFPDGGLVAPENREYVAALVQGGFIQGDAQGMLNPKGNLTRAEVAVILDRIDKYICGE